MCNTGDFEIENGVLLKYRGQGGRVVIPESVRTIETAAFSGCTHLTGVTIPESVISIGSEAFAGCNRLTSVSLPRGITRIPDGLFEFCENLTSVIIPDGVTAICGRAFRCCSSLTSIIIPNSVVGIGNGSFECCRQLTDVVIPEGVIGIGYAAFNACENLTSVRIPDSVQAIGDEAFDHCTGLADLTIPAHLAADLDKLLGKKHPPAFALHVADITDVSAKFRPNAAAGFAVDQRDGSDESGKQYLKYIRSHAAKLAQIACVHPALLYRMIREKLIAAKDLAAVTEAVQASGNAELITAMLEYGNTCVSP